MPVVQQALKNNSSFIAQRGCALKLLYVLLFVQAQLGNKITAKKTFSFDTHPQTLNPHLCFHRNQVSISINRIAWYSLPENASIPVVKRQKAASKSFVFVNIAGYVSCCATSNRQSDTVTKTVSAAPSLVAEARVPEDGRKMRQILRSVQEHNKTLSFRCRSFYRCIPLPAKVGGSPFLFDSRAPSGSPMLFRSSDTRVARTGRLASGSAGPLCSGCGRNNAVRRAGLRPDSWFTLSGRHPK